MLQENEITSNNNDEQPDFLSSRPNGMDSVAALTKLPGLPSPSHTISATDTPMTKHRSNAKTTIMGEYIASERSRPLSLVSEEEKKSSSEDASTHSPADDTDSSLDDVGMPISPVSNRGGLDEEIPNHTKMIEHVPSQQMVSFICAVDDSKDEDEDKDKDKNKDKHVAIAEKQYDPVGEASGIVKSEDGPDPVDIKDEIVEQSAEESNSDSETEVLQHEGNARPVDAEPSKQSSSPHPNDSVNDACPKKTLSGQEIAETAQVEGNHNATTAIQTIADLSPQCEQHVSGTQPQVRQGFMTDKATILRRPNSLQRLDAQARDEDPPNNKRKSLLEGGGSVTFQNKELEQARPMELVEPPVAGFRAHEPGSIAPRLDPHEQLLSRHQTFVQHYSQAYTTQATHHPTAFYPPGAPVTSAPVGGGKRRIHLRLQQDTLKSSVQPSKHKRGRSFFFTHHDDQIADYPRSSFFFRRGNSVRNVLDTTDETAVASQKLSNPDKGTISVSWYEGTSCTELQDHVRKRLVRKLNLPEGTELADMRVLDDSVEPPEEICLSPFIPDGSNFLLRYTTRSKSLTTPTKYYGPPDSPSAAPSPHPSRSHLGLDAEQLNLLKTQLDALKTPPPDNRGATRVNADMQPQPAMTVTTATDGDNISTSSSSTPDRRKKEFTRKDSEATLYPSNEDPIEARLRQITELMLLDRERKYEPPPEQRKQVVFVLANYFVLFISILAIMAEIQARTPLWLSWMETHISSVQHCAADQDTLFECVSNGDLAGLVASVAIWLTRSAATKRLFLFGFETPKKLWTVVYESLVSAVCWGFSYLMIRRGMNPHTRQNFMGKYWKDAVYGSLAGFNAAFMKQVLKNLIPQEAIEEVITEPNRLKILNWFF